LIEKLKMERDFTPNNEVENKNIFNRDERNFTPNNEVKNVFPNYSQEIRIIIWCV